MLSFFASVSLTCINSQKCKNEFSLLWPNWSYIFRVPILSSTQVFTSDPFHLFYYIFQLITSPLITGVNPQCKLQVLPSFGEVTQLQEDMSSLLKGHIIHWVKFKTLRAVKDHIIEEANGLVGARKRKQGRYT